MPLVIKGYQEIIDDLDQLNLITKIPADNALAQAGEVVKKAQIAAANRNHGPYSEDVGNKEIKRYNVKINRATGNKFVSIGLKGKGSGSSGSSKDRSTQWGKVRGLWFNNYGFMNARTGTYVAGSDWMGEAYDNSVDKAYETIKNNLLDGLKF